MEPRIVTKAALITRLRRKLAKDTKVLRTTRAGTRLRQELGEFYVVDDRNHVTGSSGNNLEEMCRDHGVLEPWERLEAE